MAVLRSNFDPKSAFAAYRADRNRVPAWYESCLPVSLNDGGEDMKKELALGVGLAVVVLAAPAVALAQGAYKLPPYPTIAQLTAAINAETTVIQRGIANNNQHFSWEDDQTSVVDNEEEYWEGASAMVKQQIHAHEEMLRGNPTGPVHADIVETVAMWKRRRDELKVDLDSIREQNDMLMSR